ncbi:MAG: hypothetical protein ACRC3H_23540 [Lachnospiraceae bacterium]
MFNLLKSELYKLKYDKLLLIISGMILLFGMNNFFLQNVTSGQMAFVQNTKDYVALFASAAYAGMSIGGDFSKRTIHKLVMAGHSRIAVLISKLISYFIGCTILYLLSIVIVTIPYTIAMGWGAAFTASEIGMTASTIFISLLFHLCTAGILFFIAFCIKETGISTAVCLFVILVVVLASNNAVTTDGTVAYAISGGTAVAQQLIIQTCIFAAVKLFLSVLGTYITFRKAELK